MLLVTRLCMMKAETPLIKDKVKIDQHFNRIPSRGALKIFSVFHYNGFLYNKDCPILFHVTFTYKRSNIIV